MKFALSILVLLFGVVTTIHAQGCNPVQTCTSSTACAVEADDLSCRCSYTKCKDFGTERCGGGCLTDQQCAQWAGGDTGCVCTWAFECGRSSMLDEPGYETYMKFMMAIKKDKITERLAILTKEMKEMEAMENALDERLKRL